MNEHPKVSVAIITYNHENFIAQALDSVLMQETQFAVEIVIGEDGSTDRTREIVVEYQKKHPQKIKALLPEKNHGDFGKTNLITTLRTCSGDYVAYLDGDDYWLSPHKLQRQADFLDAHPDCAICFHAVKRIFEDGSHLIIKPPGEKPFYSLEDLLEKNVVFSTAQMFRNRLFGEFPGWYLELNLVGDWPLSILNAQHGRIGFIDEVMSVHRKHPGGILASTGALKTWKNAIETRKFMNKQLNYEYDTIIKRSIAHYNLRLAEEYLRMGERKEAKKHLSEALSLVPFYRSLVSKKVQKVFLRTYAPWFK